MDCGEQEIMEEFRDNCNARFHWGKAGWPRLLPCFDGQKYYPETWCDFGCAVAVRPSQIASPSSPPVTPQRPLCEHNSSGDTVNVRKGVLCVDSFLQITLI